MKTTAEKILSEALDLPPEVRAFVAERLIESLNAASDAAFPGLAGGSSKAL